MTKPATISMREADWAALVYSIEAGDCILMLGPDAVTVTYEGVDVPVMIGLARFVKSQLVRMLGPEYEDLDASRPSAIAQVAVDAADPRVLRQWVKDFYQVADLGSTVLTDLAALPFRLVINTSPVLGIAEAFMAVKPATVVDHYDHTSPSRSHLPDPSIEAPVIYNLYGSLRRPDSLVLSESDRLEFLVSVITDDPPVPMKIRSALVDERAAFLFLGFSLHQWQLRLLLHVLANSPRRKLWSFALELEPSKLDAEMALFYQQGHRIHFPDMPLEDFTRQLRTRVTPPDASPGADGASKGAAVPPGAPVVFLSHASEDKAHAQRLSAALEQNDISVWLDKDDLTGGDLWREMIRRAIEAEVDYVVIVQSENLIRKDVGFVNEEIHLALERQRQYRVGRKFIIPVTVDGPDRVIPELSTLQSISVATDDGIRTLVREIYRDIDYSRRAV